MHTAQNSRGVGGTICKHNARMVGFKTGTHMLSQASLHKRGAGGAQSPLVCKHTARMVNRGGGGVSKDSYCAWRVSITTRRLSSKLAHDLKQRGVGGQPPPPICKHQCSHGWFQKHSLAQRAQQSPAICKHTAHLVNGGVSKKTQIHSRHHYLTSTVLTAVIVILIFTYIFIAIISMCMQACMNACMYMQWM